MFYDYVFRETVELNDCAHDCSFFLREWFFSRFVFTYIKLLWLFSAVVVVAHCGSLLHLFMLYSVAVFVECN